MLKYNIVSIEGENMYNNETIVDGKEIRLTDVERQNVEKFHVSRVAFAVLESDNGYELAMNINDPREHRVYLKEDFNVDDELFETLVRGYIKPGKVNFYISSSFKKVDRDKLTPKLINDVLMVASDTFGAGEYVIGNGMNVTSLGEEWEPIEIIDKINVETKERKFVKVI